MLGWGRVEVTGGFLLLMAWLNYWDTQGLLPLAVCAGAAHELGHWSCIRLLGGGVEGVRLSAVGAEMRVIGSMSYLAELLCALAGPAVNLLLAWISARFDREGVLVFGGMNLVLGCFNLLPLSVLDGGKVVSSAGALLVGPERMESVRRVFDIVVSVCLAIGGGMIFAAGGGITLVVISVWLLSNSGNGLWYGGRKKGLSRKS